MIIININNQKNMQQQKLISAMQTCSGEDLFHLWKKNRDAIKTSLPLINKYRRTALYEKIQNMELRKEHDYVSKTMKYYCKRWFAKTNSNIEAYEDFGVLSPERSLLDIIGLFFTIINTPVVIIIAFMVMSYSTTSFLEISYLGSSLPNFIPAVSAIIYSYLYGRPSNTTNIQLYATNNGDSTRPVALFTILALFLSFALLLIINLESAWMAAFVTTKFDYEAAMQFIKRHQQIQPQAPVSPQQIILNTNPNIRQGVAKHLFK